MMVFPAFLVVKIEGALMVYKSLRAKGSWAFFLPPFLPFVNLLFLPDDKAMMCKQELVRINDIYCLLRSFKLFR